MPRATLLCVLLFGIACGQRADPGQQADIESSIATLDKDIVAAEAETAKYTGGLVKALAESRLHTLKQTRAMLDQRAKSWTFGIGLRYTVDGKGFMPPADAAAQITSLEAEIARTEAQVLKHEAEAARYSGGLIQSLSLTTAATTRHSLAMLEQKRLALKFALPQFIGFAQAPAGPAVGASVAPATPAQPATSTAPADLFAIVAIDARVTETNDVWSRYAWKLTLRNRDSGPHTFDVTIEFQDKDGFVVDDDNEYGLTVPANAEQTFTGYDLVGSSVAGKVARTNAKVQMQQ